MPADRTFTTAEMRAMASALRNWIAHHGAADALAFAADEIDRLTSELDDAAEDRTQVETALDHEKDLLRDEIARLRRELVAAVAAL